MLSNPYFSVILSALMNTSGGPHIENRTAKFPVSLDMVHDLFDKAIKARNSNDINFDFSDQERWIIIEAFRFILNEYNDNIFESVIDLPKSEVARIANYFEEEWKGSIKKSSSSL